MSRSLLLRARWITPAARAWLSRRAPARVLHVFDRACNLANSHGELLSLVTVESAAGPFSLLLPGPGGKTPDWGGFLPWVEAGSKVTSDSNRVKIGDLEIDAREAEIWQPEPDWGSLQGNQRAWTSLLPQVRARLLASAPAGSLAELLQAASPGRPEASETSPIHLEVLERSAGPAREVALGVARGRAQTSRHAAQALAGLGGGLTPAGDDFLVGVMHAAWAACPPDRAEQISRVVAEAAAPRTSLLSAAWLKAAARGEAGWPWHRLIQALVGSDGPGLDEAVSRLASIGHTSGADALAGFLLAMEAFQ